MDISDPFDSRLLSCGNSQSKKHESGQSAQIKVTYSVRKKSDVSSASEVSQKNVNVASDEGSRCEFQGYMSLSSDVVNHGSNSHNSEIQQTQSAN